MKILFNCNLPFALAHGGHQIQIERTQAALQTLGLKVEPMRWWDDQQTGDLIHWFGRMPAGHITLAHQKGLKVVMAELLTGPGSRSAAQLRLQRIVNRTLKRLAPGTFISPFQWDAYQLADAIMANTAWEKHLMEYLFAADAGKTFVVPNGVEEVFFNSAPTSRGRWLVCSATVTERKRVLELARAAIQAQTPLWILGRPYSETAPYVQEFKNLVAAHPDQLRYEGAVNDRAALACIYRQSRGFVLLSAMETRSLAAEEAAACECPLLLSDLPWARSTFGKNACYCPISATGPTATLLRKFYDQTPSLPAPPRPLTWEQVAQQLKTIYEQVLGM